MEETFEQFVERMENVEKDEEFIVGPCHSGNSRAVFVFEGQYCYLESLGLAPVPDSSKVPVMARVLRILSREPKAYWWTDFEAFGEERCQRIAEHYGGRKEETFYGDEGWFHFCFDEFGDLMRLVHDRHTGEFNRIFGEVA